MRDLHKDAEAIMRGAGLITDAGLRLFEVRGDDARSWLSGQITADIASPAEGKATYGLMVTLKGRVLTDLWVLDRGALGLDLVLPEEASDLAARQLSDYIIMEDVEFAESNDTDVLTLQGPGAELVASKLDDPFVEAWPCDRTTRGGVDILVPKTKRAAIIDTLKKKLGVPSVDQAAWALACMRLAVPRFGVDFGPHTYPQEAGIEKRAVSFSKGCYLGQEAVCMLAMRGKVPRHLMRLCIESAAVAAPETKVLNEEGVAIGAITTSIEDPESPGTIQCMALIKRVHATPGAKASVNGHHGILGEIV